MLAKIREGKDDSATGYEARLIQMDEKHQHQLQELENKYQQDMMGHVEQYQARGFKKEQILDYEMFPHFRIRAILDDFN